MASGSDIRESHRAAVGALVFVLAMIAAPLVWRVAVDRWGPPISGTPSYLPGLQARRDRDAFNPDPIEGLQAMQPSYVIIGDSMGGRVDPAYFTQISDRHIAPMLWNATGSAHWFLVFKNYVVASGIKPTLVLVFFRDGNLTDPMRRLSMDGLDEVAAGREDELNHVVAERTQGAWFRVHMLADEVYGLERARDWLEPALTARIARIVAGRVRRQAFVDQMNGVFALDALRPMTAADELAADERDLDFGAFVGTSLLPEFLKLADAHHLRLCFVRVLRRPTNGRPPQESPRLKRYVRDLRQYLETHGAAYLDDRDIPELATLAYNDGDHIAYEARARYTELFWARISGLPK